MELFQLKQKTAVITGGASGLGYSIASGFGEAGANLILLDADDNKLNLAKEKLIKEGYNCEVYQVDITNAEIVKNVSEQIKQVDVLVNSAGINIRKSAMDLTVEEYQKVLDVNLTGTFLTCKIFGEKMVAQQRGSIINIASIHSHVTMKNQSAYASTKGGVMQLTKVLALEFASHNVRVNSLAPGFHLTPLVKELMNNEKKYNNLIERIPMGRIAQPDEIIGPALFLASDASSYVTGISLVSDGGYIAQ